MIALHPFNGISGIVSLPHVWRGFHFFPTCSVAGNYVSLLFLLLDTFPLRCHLALREGQIRIYIYE